MFLRLTIGTIVVLGLCVFTIWLCKRFGIKGVPATPALARMKLVESLPLGQRCCVHLIHVADKPVLVAMDAGGIKSMVALPDSFAHVLQDTEVQEPVAA